MARSRTNTMPIDVIRSRRAHPLAVLTSMPAGRMTPIAVIPLLREDQLDGMPVRLTFNMMETTEVLMNSVLVSVKAYLVPHLAFKRYEAGGMDHLNRSWDGKPMTEGGPVTPFIETATNLNYGSNTILKYLGKHWRLNQPINTGYVEAYNMIWNFRARNRSPNLAERSRLQTDLAPAFWQHSQFDHIVPDFDQASVDGAVPLTIVGGGKLAVKSEAGQPIRMKTLLQGEAVQKSLISKTDNDVAVTGTAPASASGLQLADVSNVFAELQQNGIVVSLANIEMARKTQAFANLRRQYNELPDEYLIDMLMDGLTIPEQSMRQPMLIGEASTVFGMSKRYASDGANLTKTVVEGLTEVELRLRTPRVPCGGIVMIVAEVTPEQLFERQEDPYLALTSAEQMPHYLRDFADPEKVEVVKNGYIDVKHSSPNATFGYAPLNHRWNYSAPAIGGKFYRPAATTTVDEDRQRIWAVETENPTLSADFYVCNQMHTKVFALTKGDPFEVIARGEGVISGNTVFGEGLIEATNDYAEVLEEIDQSRIVKP